MGRHRGQILWKVPLIVVGMIALALGASLALTLSMPSVDYASDADLLAACRDVTGSDATFTWVDPDWLTKQDVEEWTEIPLWSAEPGTFRHDNRQATTAGLPRRPIHQTVADTWAWQQTVPGGWRPTEQTPGLEPGKERRLLEDWRGTTTP